MNKLIDLLNEYEEEKKKETWLRAYEWKCYCDWHLIQATNVVHKKGVPLALIETRSLLISKTYWFIEWLVQKNKIDLWNIKKLYRKSNENNTATYPILYDYTYDESLLMYLSIQDDPIQFLIDILA